MGMDDAIKNTHSYSEHKLNISKQETKIRKI